ncbi:hypothetical protein [Candidatus Anaplasma sp. TIGMIC]|nr:hypothetical protein [Candidatus Anaplasma sp. TIGMIC]
MHLVKKVGLCVEVKERHYINGYTLCFEILWTVVDSVATFCF